ncbi:ThuA domain-containing protein [Adhaeribacter aquaticus]|uniref:ThuA domain-containing protein n=1 Tax=Adhaeribacter aquaticus TaxID=299567 RepID=UPI0004155B25|nr:ThuA domain-containing protein [Adhaeribacter aquaticus]
MKKYHFPLVILMLLWLVAPAWGQQFKVLVYTSPDRWHDPTIPVAMQEFREMALKHHFELAWAQKDGNAKTTDPFSDEYLKQFKVVVFLHSRGYDLSAKQMESFKRFIRNGGGFVGIHAPAANKGQQEWFQKLIGRVFTDHPEEQTAVMNVQDRNFPATMHLPEKWVWTDEWYSFGEAFNKNLKLLMTVDEKTYDPDRTWNNPNRKTAMGKFHPISWYHEYDGGRSFYTALGHIPAAYKDPWFLAHIYGGIYWAATGLGVPK